MALLYTKASPSPASRAVQAVAKNIPALNFKLSIRDALSYGWHTTKKNLKYLTALTFLLGFSSIIPKVLINLTQDIPWLTTTITLINWALAPLFLLGFTVLMLSFVNKKRLPIYQLYTPGLKLYLKYLVASAFVTIITTAGFILLIIPGVILAVRLQFFPYLLIEQNIKPFAAIKKSWHITKGFTLKLALFGLIAFGLSLAGTLLVLVGLLFTTPLTALAQIFIYRQLVNHRK